MMLPGLVSIVLVVTPVTVARSVNVSPDELAEIVASVRQALAGARVETSALSRAALEERLQSCRGKTDCVEQQLAATDVDELVWIDVGHAAGLWVVAASLYQRGTPARCEGAATLKAKLDRAELTEKLAGWAQCVGSAVKAPEPEPSVAPPPARVEAAPPPAETASRGASIAAWSGAAGSLVASALCGGFHLRARDTLAGSYSGREGQRVSTLSRPEADGLASEGNALLVAFVLTGVLAIALAALGWAVW